MYNLLNIIYSPLKIKKFLFSPIKSISFPFGPIRSTSAHYVSALRARQRSRSV